MQETTPIFGEEDEVSCMSILENEFLLQYPMLTRQVDFFSSCQGPGQAFSDWVADLRKLGDEAGLASLTVDEIYMMRYFTGLTDMDLRKKFFKEIEPNLKKLNAIVKQHEIRKSNERSISNKSREMTRKISYDSNGGYKRENSQRKVCARCGYTGHSPDDCRHKNAICHNCQGKGHLSGACLEPKKKNEQKIKARLVLNGSSVPSEDISVRSNVEQSDEDDVESNRVLVRVCKTSKDSPRINVTVSGSGANFDFKACADTGTSRSIIGYDIAKVHGLRIYPAKERIFAANGERMNCEGRTPLGISFRGITTPVMALVSSNMSQDLLISMGDLKKMKVLPKEFPDLPAYVIRVTNGTIMSRKIDMAADEIRQEFLDVLSDALPETPMAGEPMTIHLVEDAKPTRCLTARSFPLHWKVPAEQALSQMIDRHILVREPGPTDWVSPGFFVPKGEPQQKKDLKEGMVVITFKDLRLVVDYTGLNRFVKRPVHPSPPTRDIINNIPSGTRFFCTLDCVQGYHQIELSEESSRLTTFIMPSGKYRFKRAPKGLNASSDEWCRRSDEAIQGLRGTLKIVDDVLVMAPTLSILVERVRGVLSRFRKFKITASLKKFQMGTEVKFAGHCISGEGVKPNPDTSKAISGFEPPSNLTELRSFLGLANQLANFVPDLAHMTDSLRRLLKKNVIFQWLPEHQSDFEKIKELLTSSAVVGFFDSTWQTELLTDASKTKGLGFALMQRHPETGRDKTNSMWQQVAYACRRKLCHRGA